MKNLKFSKGIRKIHLRLSDGQTKVRLTKDGLDLLNGLCNDINSRLVDDCKVEFSSAVSKKNGGGEQKFTPLHVSNVIKRTFRRRLKDQALAEGQRGLTKFQNNLIDYDPRKALVPMKKSKTVLAHSPVNSQSPAMMFANKLGLLLNHVHPDMCLTPKARKHCSETLYSILNKLVAKTAQAASGKANVGIEDVCIAIESMLGEVMWQHAKNEGENSIKMFHDGILQFKPTNPRDFNHLAPKSDHPHHNLPKPSLKSVFCTGIKHLATDVHNGCPINEKAVKRTNIFITNVAQKLASTAVNHAVASGITEITPMEMQVALHEIMPLELCDNAKTEGNRAVMLFKNDLLHFVPKPYTPRAIRAPRNKKTRTRSHVRNARGTKPPKLTKPAGRRAASRPPIIKMPQPDFGKSLQELLSEFNKDMCSMNRKSAEMINTSLVGVCKKLAEYSISLAEQREDKTVTPEDVRKAVLAKFPDGSSGPSGMKDHAMAQGDRELLSYTEGCTAVKFTALDRSSLQFAQRQARETVPGTVEEQQNQEALQDSENDEMKLNTA